jgi:serine/threonine protein kinase
MPENTYDNLDNQPTQRANNAEFELDTGVTMRGLVGLTLGGRFEIIEEVGRGGMGVVYRARDTRLNREIAVKVLPEEVRADPQAISDLLREVAISQDLTHQNIVRLHDLQETPEATFLTMEFIDGPSLIKVLADSAGPLPVDRVIEMFGPFCEGLAYAHTHAVIHQDIKPHNVMLTSAGVVKICDFGIASVLSETASRVTRQGTSGTLVYMSPEQLRGKRIDRTVDIYAAGAMAYHLLTGHPPFYRGDVSRQITDEQPEPLDGVPEHVNVAILKALAKTPEERWASVEEFAGAMRGETISAFAPSDESAVAPDIIREQRVGKRTDARGHLYISTNPSGATVWIDDEERGTTPCMVESLPAGQVAVLLTMSDRDDVEVTADIRADEYARLDDVELKESTTTVNIVSDPLDANIEWDGEDVGRTPITIREVVVGEHDLTLSKAEYVPLNELAKIPAEGMSISRKLESEEKVRHKKEGNGSNITKQVGRNLNAFQHKPSYFYLKWATRIFGTALGTWLFYTIGNEWIFLPQWIIYGDMSKTWDVHGRWLVFCSFPLFIVSIGYGITWWKEIAGTITILLSGVFATIAYIAVFEHHDHGFIALLIFTMTPGMFALLSWGLRLKIDRTSAILGKRAVASAISLLITAVILIMWLASD